VERTLRKYLSAPLWSACFRIRAVSPLADHVYGRGQQPSSLSLDCNRLGDFPCRRQAQNPSFQNFDDFIGGKGWKLRHTSLCPECTPKSPHLSVSLPRAFQVLYVQLYGLSRHLDCFLYGISVCDTSRKRWNGYSIASLRLFSEQNTITQSATSRHALFLLFHPEVYYADPIYQFSFPPALEQIGRGI